MADNEIKWHFLFGKGRTGADVSCGPIVPEIFLGLSGFCWLCMSVCLSPYVCVSACLCVCIFRCRNLRASEKRNERGNERMKERTNERKSEPVTEGKSKELKSRSFLRISFALSCPCPCHISSLFLFICSVCSTPSPLTLPPSFLLHILLSLSV